MSSERCGRAGVLLWALGPGSFPSSPGGVAGWLQAAAVGGLS